MTYDEARADRLAHFMLKKVNRAVREFNMIEDGDRIAVALSGGKDSFSLLKILQYRQRFSPERFELVGLHVVGDARGRDLPPYPEMEAWLREQDVEYLMRPTHMAEDETIPMPCQRCTWNRRRTLFEMATSSGCNKLAFGHHLDDLAETALMNLIYQGKLETMSPVRGYLDGKLSIIRPLAYVPEREIVRFASVNEFPPPPPECPHGRNTERRHMKDTITDMTRDSRKIRENIVRAALGK